MARLSQYIGLFYGHTGLFHSNCHSVSYTEKCLDAQGSFVDMVSYIGLFYGSVGLFGANRHPVSRVKKYSSTEGSFAYILRVVCCRLCGDFFEVNIFAEYVGLFCAYIRLFGANLGFFLRSLNSFVSLVEQLEISVHSCDYLWGVCVFTCALVCECARIRISRWRNPPTSRMKKSLCHVEKAGYYIPKAQYPNQKARWYMQGVLHDVARALYYVKRALNHTIRALNHSIIWKEP